MLDKLKQMAQSLLGDKPAISQEIITEAFLPLAIINEAYPKKVVSYILTGEHADILIDLAQLQDDRFPAVLDAPGSLIWWYPSAQISEKLLGKKHNKAASSRNRFYTLWTENFTNEQIIRFGKVLAAGCRDLNLKPITAQLPQWFLYLFCDGLGKSIEDIKGIHFSKCRNHWTAQHLHELLEQEQTDLGDKLLFAVFDRQNLPEYYTDRLKHVFQLPDLEDYILNHLDQFKQLPKQGLSAVGQIEQIKYLTNNPKVCAYATDFIVAQATSSLKTVRTVAESLLVSLDRDAVKDPLQNILLHGDNKQRAHAALLIARQTENKDILQQALAQEKNKTVIQSIENALARFDSLDSAQNMGALEIPAFSPIEEVKLPACVREILQQNYEELLVKAKEAAQREIEENKSRNYRYSWCQEQHKRLQKITSAQLDQMLPFLNGEAGQTNQKYGTDEGIIMYKKRLQSLPEFSFLHMLRAHLYNRHDRNNIHLYYLLSEHSSAKNLDLRQIADALARVGLKNPEREIAEFFLRENYYEPIALFADKKLIWPFFTEYPEFLNEALGLIPSPTPNQARNYYMRFDTAAAFDILALFPAIPAHYVPRILEIALGEGKLLRPKAQALLASIPDIHQRAEEALGSSKQEIRITAAQWLVALKQPSSVKALYTALKKEKRETVRAALLTALEAFGEDISDYLSPKVLLEEAEKGLKGKAPASLSWFNFDLIPAFTWQNGQTVDVQIIQWWIILAVKLKDPAGNALLQRYVGLLAKESQQKLGVFLLQTFIHQDTLCPSMEEALEEAQREAPQRLKNYKDWFKRYPEYYGKYEHATLDDIVEEIKREVLSRYLGSAISDKGMLALISGIEGHIAVTTLRNYMRDHYTRRAQIEAMLMAVANSNDPLVIQLLLSVARRYRTHSVQLKARELVEEVAERNGWSADELADRTIPTAGLDETGVLSLDYGERIFIARMNEKYSLTLFNPDGKEIKTLPEPRKTEDEALAKDAKKQFSTSKKELKQIIDLQTSRLYEAMCAKRQWTVADWQEYLHAHPVMNILIQRLVWLEVDKNENIIESFRPTEDGSLINLEDDEIELKPEHHIILAHAAILAPEQSKAWLAHFKDYKVKPLFAQMINSVPDISKVNEGLIEDCLGWVTDTFTLRGILTKLGYKRADAEDGGSFDHYNKSFDSLGLYVNIYFSGSYLPEENIPAVLFNVNFTDGRGWRSETLEIDKVPPILLAEGYADYMKVADACSGFDPEWEKKTPW